MGLQQRITTACAEIDGRPFVADPWRKEPGEPLQGDGVTMILFDDASSQMSAFSSRCWRSR